MSPDLTFIRLGCPNAADTEIAQRGLVTIVVVTPRTRPSYARLHSSNVVPSPPCAHEATTFANPLVSSSGPRISSTACTICQRLDKVTSTTLPKAMKASSRLQPAVARMSPATLMACSILLLRLMHTTSSRQAWVAPVPLAHRAVLLLLLLQQQQHRQLLLRPPRPLPRPMARLLPVHLLLPLLPIPVYQT